MGWHLGWDDEDDEIYYCYECWDGVCPVHQPEHFEEFHFSWHITVEDDFLAEEEQDGSALERALFAWTCSEGPMLALIEFVESRYDKIDSKGHS